MTRLREKSSLGLAVDIDDTLCDTNVYWLSRYLKDVGDSRKAIELLWSHGRVRDIGLASAAEYVNNVLADEEHWGAMPPILHAVDVLRRNQDRICMYISARPIQILRLTRDWLHTHDFPDKPLLLRPDTVDARFGEAWKVEQILRNTDSIGGVVDDSIAVLQGLRKRGYSGLLWHFSHLGVRPGLSTKMDASFETWKDIDSALAQLPRDPQEFPSALRRDR